MIFAKNILKDSAFFIINKKIVEDIGFDSALFFSILCDGESVHGEYFYQTRDMILNLSYGYIKKTRYENCLRDLESGGFIKTEMRKGLPPRRYFKIEAKNIKTGDDDVMGNLKMKDIIGQQAFFMLNKLLVKKLGWESAMFLSILADAEKIFSDDDANAGFVYQTQPTVEEMSMGVLTRRKQDTAIKALVAHEIIEQRNMGIPCKRYFKINSEKLLELLSQ